MYAIYNLRIATLVPPDQCGGGVEYLHRSLASRRRRRKGAPVPGGITGLPSKGLNTKDIHKEVFPVYGGKCLSRKAVHNWVGNVSLMSERLKRRCGSG
jgi:hypothetical protein